MSDSHTAGHHLELFAAGGDEPCTRPRVHAAHPVVDMGGSVGQVELRHLLVQHGGKGSILVLLRHSRQSTCSDLRNRFTQSFGTHSGNAVEQFTAGLLGVDDDLFAVQHITGIQPLIHLHDGNAGLGVTVQHRPLHRSAAAIFRQQRNVQVDAAIAGHFQHGLRQNAAIGHHYDQFRGKGADIFILAAVPQGAGLEHRRAVCQSNLLDRRCGEHLFTADRLIPPGVHSTDIVPGSIQGFQALGSNIRRAHEQNAHQLFPFASRAAFLPSSVSS